MIITIIINIIIILITNIIAIIINHKNDIYFHNPC